MKPLTCQQCGWRDTWSGNCHNPDAATRMEEMPDNQRACPLFRPYDPALEADNPNIILTLSISDHEDEPEN